VSVNVVGIAGSLRAGSFNRMLLHTAVERAPEGLVIHVADFRGLPVYDGDLEAAAYPAEATALKELIRAADGLLIVTPEYNFGVPGPLKNAIDWLSRPVPESPFAGKPVGTMGASTGWAGTVRAQMAWQHTWQYLHAPYYVGGAVHVSSAASSFTDGKLTNELLLRDLDTYLAGFRDWVAGLKRLAEDGQRG
jgi:chromate reductase, NAD(P)H dehydrogenase (quinone)